MLALKSPERVTLAEALTILERQVPSDQAKLRLRQAFIQKAFHQQPLFALPYEEADIDWTTGSVKIPRKRYRFCPTFLTSDFEDHIGLTSDAPDYSILALGGGGSLSSGSGDPLSASGAGVPKRSPPQETTAATQQAAQAPTLKPGGNIITQDQVSGPERREKRDLIDSKVKVGPFTVDWKEAAQRTQQAFTSPVLRGIFGSAVTFIVLVGGSLLFNWYSDGAVVHALGLVTAKEAEDIAKRSASPGSLEYPDLRYSALAQKDRRVGHPVTKETTHKPTMAPSSPLGKNIRFARSHKSQQTRGREAVA